MSWRLLSGSAEWFWDETLREVGRRRFHAQRNLEIVRSEASTIFPQQRDRAGFLFQRDPWRLALFGIEGHLSGSTLIHWGRAFNLNVDLVDGTLIQQVVGPEDSANDHGLRRMLEPSSLEQLVPTPWPDEFTIEGHALEANMFVAPELVSLSTDYYTVTYDRELGVLMSWQSIIDGHVAQSLTLNAIAVLR